MALTIVSLPLTVLSQGRVTLGNDSLHLFYYGPSAGILAGSAVSSVNMPVGVTLLVDLYGGTSPQSLTLLNTTTFSVSSGRISTSNFNPSYPPGGQTNFFEVQVRDSAYPSEAAAQAAGSWYGNSEIFTMFMPGAGLSDSDIDNPSAPYYSTWSGDFDMSSQSGLPGALGAVAVNVVPEPSILPFAGFAVAAFSFRRRK